MADSVDYGEHNLASLDLNAVNEGTAVELLRKRYTHGEIYTAIGDILLSVNPFKALPIYGKEVIQAYKTSKADTQLPPHVYSKCKDILRSMRNSSKSQCCVLTGESSSGKTECLKQMLQYIVSTTVSTQTSLKSKLLQVQFILEAFGNAATLQNSNSSRFAMHYQVYFSPDYKLSGGKVYHYMLEKSRIVHQEKGSKNFHIFHYLLYGLDADQLQEYNLSSDFPHRYLSYDPLVPAEDVASKEIKSEKYGKLISYMESVGFSNEEILNTLKCVASVLHIGNIAFDTTNPQTNLAVVRDPQPVRCASSLLGVSVDQLGAALISGTAYRKGVRVSAQKTVDSAAEGRDNLARTLYSRLFSWLVLKVNSCLKEKSEDSSRQRFGPAVGLLDVFGFERFEINGLEQLSINTANEQLAHFYNQRVFAWEQTELETEGLRSSKIPYYDNTKTVELLLNPPQGLLSLLDEESRNVQATDAAFVKKCDSLHRKHPDYDRPKLSYPAFTIHHYAGPVTYVTLGFLSSNRDMLSGCLLDCLQGSSNEFISRLFRAKISGTGSMGLQPERMEVPYILMQKKKNKRNPTIRHKAAVVQHLAGKESRQDKNGFQTVGMQLRKSITELMEKVLSCEVHFVRCIKPNRHQAPDEFNPDLVLTQLRSLAVVETAHIRNLGFPVWFTFDTFIQRFGVVISLLPNVPIKDKQQTCLKMLRQLVDDPRGWKIGKTKVFLSYWCVERLNAFLERMGAVAVVIQRGFRGWQARKLYSRLKRLKVAQENTVTAFLDTIGKRSEVMLQHISNQVMEEDAKQKLKVNEMASLQRQPWSPNVFNQKSPAASSQQTSFDFKDTPDGFPPLSPRRTSLQQRVSDLSVSSLSDTPSRPGPPQSRMSDLSVTSVTSVGSTFSVESDDFDTAAPQVWCKITCFEREHPRGEFSIDRPSIVIDGSNNSFDVTRIGLGTLPPSSDSKVTKVRACIGKGMEIVNDEEGNVWATRGSKNAIFVKGHFLSDEVISLKGALEKDSTLKVFDWEAFADSVRYHCLHSKNFDPTIENMVLSSASIFFSFVKDGKDDVSTPCWIQLDVLSALQQGKAACKYAREKRQQEKQQVINSLPPILRPKTRKSRELAAVAHFQQKVRPRRYVDTFKFNRKKWARKEVAMNPFLYGKGKELSQGRRQKPLKAQPAKSNSDPEETLDGAPPGPESLMHLFGSNSDARDGGASQALTSNGSFVVSDLDSSLQAHGFQYHEAKREVTSTSAVEKPAKKVWAKKKFADNKAEKGRKRS